MVEVFTWRTQLRYPYTTEYEQRVIVTPKESGKEQRRLTQSVRRKVFGCQGVNMSHSTAGSIESFMSARRGIYEAFYFSDPNDYIIASEAVGTGDGSTVAFSLDKSYIASTTEAVTVDSVAQTRNIDYTIDNDTGIVTFTAAPANTKAIKAGYQFYYLVRNAKEPRREDAGYQANNYHFNFIEVIE